MSQARYETGFEPALEELYSFVEDYRKGILPEITLRENFERLVELVEAVKSEDPEEDE